MKEISNLNLRKVCQDNDISTKIIKGNKYFFSFFLYTTVSITVYSVFPPDLKKLTSSLFIKRKKTRWVFFPLSQKSVKDVRLIWYTAVLVIFPRDINVVFVKTLVPNTVCSMIEKWKKSHIKKEFVERF